MKLINPDEIRFVLAPIAPLLSGEQVHYESVAFQQVIGMIRRIEAEPVKHAHWVACESDEYEDEYKCSACGIQFIAIEPQEEGWKYCPCCGAKMDEEGKDD